MNDWTLPEVREGLYGRACGCTNEHGASFCRSHACCFVRVGGGLCGLPLYHVGRCIERDENDGARLKR